MKKFSLIFLFMMLFAYNNMQAQQEIILTKYTYNSMFFNPAYAGSHGYNEGTALLHYRNQWLGFKGAPTTLVAGTEMSLFKNKVGIGLGFANEKIGVENRNDININTAYRMRLDKGYLSGGIRVAFSHYNNNYSDVDYEVAEPSLFNSYNLFSVGAGIYYNTDGFYMGLAVPTLAVASKSKEIGDRKNHFYFHTGLMIGDEYATVKFEPSLLLKYERSVPVQFTLGLNAWLTEYFSVGAHYRSQDAVALSTELHFLKNYRIALAYDFTTSEIRNHSNGTIEMLLGYKFNLTPNNPRIKSLRYAGRF